MDEHEDRLRHKFPVRRLVGLTLVVVGGIILAFPFLPWIRFALLPPNQTVQYETRLAGTSYLPKAANKAPKKPSGNRLVIPKIGVDASIVEGATQAALWSGIWHIPNTSSPDAGGNTVLSGHRFQYRPPSTSTLYLLDRLNTGDPIIIYWQGQEYDYVVRERRIVEPNAVEILAPTEKAQLTIFTCTPLFTTKQRLVLIAEPIQGAT